MQLKSCKHCGKSNVKIYSDGYCQVCHLYIKKGGQFHPLPSKGEVAQDERGYYICHICGTAHSKLGEHIRRKHLIAVDEYKEEFGLCKSQRLTADDYHDKMREHNLRTNASSNFDETRPVNKLKKGDAIRLGEERRLQEVIKLRKQSEEIKNRKLEG